MGFLGCFCAGDAVHSYDSIAAVISCHMCTSFNDRVCKFPADHD